MADPQVLDALAPWKRKRFREYELSWIKATESLETDTPLIGVKSNKPGSRWTVYNKSTDKLAIFFHVALWAYGGPPGSGNFVPEGETSPPGLFVNKIITYVGRRAETTYTIHTVDDQSFYHASRIMEGYVTAQEEFNKYKKPRRTWQDGNSDFARRRFVFASRLFLLKTPYTSMDTSFAASTASPYPLHPWVTKAANDSKNAKWIVNPDAPGLYDLVDGKISLIEPKDHRYFRNGDIVWFSFALTFELDGDEWGPEFKPLNFIRVGHMEEPPESRGEYTVESEVGPDYRSLTTGNVTLLDDDDDPTFDDPANRKRGRDSDDDETMSDGGLSDLSAYSAARVAGVASKRQKVDVSQVKALKGEDKPLKSEDTSKRRTTIKSKGK
ncbi:hypothetical protein B0H16DRAFT_1682386 [Mycena metata]|uniref:Uncharacterized protein n=1 Tax=Mycena metata TaxID=1033252 RepID=A0AAD7P0B0_9AGAR|nr:hypothetical protein B0H16DRAFT_1682386 [Mycena metata]